MDDNLLYVENVSVKYCRNLHRSLRYGLSDILAELLPIAKAGSDLRPDEFWALRNITFSLKRGECLGLIGPNGSGKSTLLKIVSGLFKPDSGTIAVRGKVGALIELGTGFKPILTGRENVYINGAILGLSRRETEWKFDKILDFAEIGDFIDAPVQSYSTGMALRLAFAIAVNLEVDVLLLDEIFAVGDIRFRSKCFHEMQRLLSRSAVIFVSHSMPQIAQLSSKVMLLNHGNAIYYGPDVRAGIERYYSLYSKSQSSTVSIRDAAISGLFLSSAEQTAPPGAVLTIQYKSPLIIGICVSAPAIEMLEIDILFHDDETSSVAEFHSETFPSAKSSPMELCVSIGEMPLNPGRYLISLVLRNAESHEILAMQTGALGLSVTGDYYGSTPVRLSGYLTLTAR